MLPSAISSKSCTFTCLAIAQKWRQKSKTASAQVSINTCALILWHFLCLWTYQFTFLVNNTFKRKKKSSSAKNSVFHLLWFFYLQSSIYLQQCRKLHVMQSPPVNDHYIRRRLRMLCTMPSTSSWRPRRAAGSPACRTSCSTTSTPSAPSTSAVSPPRGTLVGPTLRISRRILFSCLELPPPPPRPWAPARPRCHQNMAPHTRWPPAPDLPSGTCEDSPTRGRPLLDHNNCVINAQTDGRCLVSVHTV